MFALVDLAYNISLISDTSDIVKTMKAKISSFGFSEVDGYMKVVFES
jgi:hypothetical protein